MTFIGSSRLKTNATAPEPPPRPPGPESGGLVAGVLGLVAVVGGIYWLSARRSPPANPLYTAADAQRLKEWSRVPEEWRRL